MATSTLGYTPTLEFKGTIASGDNLNNYIGNAYTGLYSVQNSVTNSPADWSTLMVMSSSEDGGIQFVLVAGHLYVRQRAGNPRTWTAWTHFTGTQMS